MRRLKYVNLAMERGLQPASPLKVLRIEAA
jgi:hypothetical protein